MFAPEPLIALFLLRLLLGGLTVAHGVMKTPNMAGFAAAWGLPGPVAWAVACTQIVGGLCLILGLATPLAALAQLGLNGVITAMLILRAKEPFLAPARHSWSIGLIYAGMSLIILIGGPGAFALDDALG